MNARAVRCDPDAVLAFRARHREELNCQIVHDSIHRRPGWVRSYQLEADGSAVGFASIAIGGPWTEHPAFYEFYLLPSWRFAAFTLFEELMAADGARRFEVQSNEELAFAVALAYAREMETERIVFRDGVATGLPANGGHLHALTPPEEVRSAIERRQGGGEWRLEVDGVVAGKGGVLFHYNRPYGDIWMEIEEPFRRKGWGAFLVQELKRETYALGAIPAARCNPGNLASRRTLAKAGFVPCAHILIGRLEMPGDSEKARG